MGGDFVYKIIIAEDEIEVREGIRDNMDWQSLGYELVADCENGSVALEAIERLLPDVVLTDINMPFVNGIELAQNITALHPHIKFIFLTGYDDFEYAHQAMKLKVFDYLVKPITLSELKVILNKVKDELDKEITRSKDIELLKKQLWESFPLLKERFLNRIISGNLKKSELDSKLDYFGIKLNKNHYAAISIDLDEINDGDKLVKNDDYELLKFAVYNISEELLVKHGGIVFYNRDDRIVAILADDDINMLQDTILQASEEIRFLVEKHLETTVSIGIGYICDSLSTIKSSYKSASSALDYRFMLGKNRIISAVDTGYNPTANKIDKTGLQNKLIKAIKSGTTEDINAASYSIIQELRHANIHVYKCFTYIQQIFSQILNMLDEINIEAEDVFGNINPLSEISACKTLDDAGEWIKNTGFKISDCIIRHRVDNSQTQVKNAEKIIVQNYADPNISLNDVCKHLYISPNYFSMIFKNQTGKTFVEYLTEVRTNKAMELMKATSLKTYEISNSVGYINAHYFSIVFKKATGYTPTEYREKVSGGAKT